MFTTLGNRIRAARRAYGDAQLDLAEHFGISRAAVSQWETGDTEPELAKLEGLAERYSLSLEWLLHGKGTPPTLPEPGRRRRIFVSHHGSERGTIQAFSGIINEIPALEAEDKKLQAWSIPSYALRSQPAQTIIFRAIADLGTTIRNGDYVLVDQNQRDVQWRGFWLIELPLTGLCLARSRISKKNKDPVIELIDADDVVHPLSRVKRIVGRATGRLTPIA